jgi:hypothetical protein
VVIWLGHSNWKPSLVITPPEGGSRQGTSDGWSTGGDPTAAVVVTEGERAEGQAGFRADNVADPGDKAFTDAREPLVGETLVRPLLWALFCPASAKALAARTVFTPFFHRAWVLVLEDADRSLRKGAAESHLPEGDRHSGAPERRRCRL